MQEPPAKLKTTAIIQLVSGLLNIFVMAAVVSGTLFTVCGFVPGLLGSLVMCPLGFLCGFVGLVGLLLVPIGIFEVVSGILGLTNPASAGKIMRIASYVEMGSILVGGLISLIAGIIAFSMLRDPEVAGYIETASIVE